MARAGATPRLVSWGEHELVIANVKLWIEGRLLAQMSSCAHPGIKPGALAQRRNNVRRLFLATVVGTMVFGAVLASASTLPIDDPGTIQVGAVSLTNCQTTPLTVVWNADYTGTVTSAQVSNIDPTCDGQNLYFYALNAAGHIVGANHSPSVDCGAPGTPISVTPYPIGSPTAKVALGYVHPADDQLTSPTYPCGVPGEIIAGVRIVIGV